MSTTKAFAPQYYKGFECLGGSCSCDCCHDLLIKVDKETCEKYLALEDGRFRDELLKSIEVSDETPFSASISLNEAGDCPFLNSDGLCDVQLQRGHEFLSYACRTYPRIYCETGGNLEAYMSLGCEAVASRALFNPEAMTLCEVAIHRKVVYGNILKPEVYIKSENAYDIFVKLRGISVYILQLRKHRLWLRVAMLGYFIELVGGYLAQGREDIFTQQVVDYVNSLEESYDDDEYRNKVPDWHELKVSLIYKLLERLAYIRQDKKRDDINTCFQQIKEGLGVTDGEQPLHELVSNYTRARDAHYAPYFEEHEYVLENYLVNTVLATGFPFTYRSEKSIYENYVKLVVEFSVVKFLLVGMAGYHKENFGQGAIVKAIAAFSRLFDHSRSLADAVADVFKHNGTTDMRTICMLAKD